MSEPQWGSSPTTQPEQVEKKKTVKLNAAQLTSFLLHPARPSFVLSLTAVLEPTTARPSAWKFDVGELLDINSHDTPLVYRWVVRTSPRKYVTAVDEVGRIARRLLPAQRRHYSATYWPPAARHKHNYERLPKKRLLDRNHCCLMYGHINWPYFRGRHQSVLRSSAKSLDFGPYITSDM